MRCYDKPIMIQVRDEGNKQWITFLSLHAHVNATASDEYTSAGSSRSTYRLTFSVRYNPLLKEVALDMQRFRIVYDRSFYRITSYDDYAMQHQEVKLIGETYG